MHETTPEFHNLELALATAQKMLDGLPDHKINGDLDELKLKAYVMLRHAAFEEYFERASVYALRECMRVFDEEGKLAEPLAAVCIYYNLNGLSHFHSPANSLKINDLFRHICQKAIEAHNLALVGVHGIKTKDQDTVFLPLGIKMHDFDHVLSQKLNSLGTNRGGVAHQFRIRQVHPKKALESDTKALLKLVLPFDNELCRRVKIYYEA